MTQIDYPFHVDGRGRTAGAAAGDHIRDMIEEFLLTSPGERVNRPGFGGGLLQKVFDPNSPELAGALQFTIQAGLQQWLGDLVEVRSLEVTSKESALQAEIFYAVRSTGEVVATTVTMGGSP